MVGFFSRGRKQEYHGFSKYQEELRHSASGGMVAGLPNPSQNRSQSFSNGAGQAAAAALRMHSLPSLAQRQLYHPQQQQQHSQQRAGPPRRANSLSSANRSNSLRSYTYHPKGSYTPGSAQVPTASVSSRSNSLVARSTFTPVPEDDHYDEVEEVVTTKTTKIVDSQGRTQSIKTTTIRTMPDGSNVIETTTKNISRSNSRANSLNSSNLRAGSLLSADNPINLTKIDEDLHDFDYNYEMDSQMRPQVKLNISKNNESAVSENAAILAEQTTESPTVKPLRSILKNNQHTAFEASEDSQFTEAGESPKKTSEAHPYKAIHTEALQGPKFKVPASPPFNPKSPTKRHSPNREDILSSASSSIKFDERVETIPVYNTSKSNGLGKAFNPRKELPKKEPPKNKTTTDADFYAAAMKAAYKKVYGQDQPQTQASPSSLPGRNVPESPTSPENQTSPTQFQPPASARSGNRTFSLSSNISSIMENRKVKTKPSKSKALEEVGGVNSDFHYGAHHKDFVKHSLRESIPKSSTRKERSKDEKRLLKEAQAEKDLAEKQAKKEAKLQQKLAKKEKKKAPENKTFLGLFGKRKSSISDGNDTEASFAPFNAPGVSSENNHEVDSRRELRPDLVIPEKDEFTTPEPVEISHDQDVIAISNSKEKHTVDDELASFAKTKDSTSNYALRDNNPISSSVSQKAPQTLTVDEPLATPQHSEAEVIVPEVKAITPEVRSSQIEKAKEIDYVNTSASSPYLSASSPNEYEQARDNLEQLDDHIPVPSLSDIETPGLYSDSEDEDTQDHELGANINKSAMENAILGRQGSPLEFASAKELTEGAENNPTLPEPEFSHTEREVDSASSKPETISENIIQQEYEVATAFIDGDGYKPSESELNLPESQVTAQEGLEKEDEEPVPQYGNEIEESITPKLQNAATDVVSIDGNGKASHLAEIPISVAESTTEKKQLNIPLETDEALNSQIGQQAPVQPKAVSTVKNETIIPSEATQSNPSAEIIDAPKFIPGTSAPLSPHRIPAAAANVTAPVPLATNTSKFAPGGPPGAVASSSESPGDDKSTVPTLASQNSEQPTNSTVATEHQPQVNHGTTDHAYEKEVTSVPRKSNKSKKSSKIRERIFKYFINSYDK
ncbi:uncharacterized protein CANTADRAFT_19688 [Suhomyces tanzawaensis NRRL Y-17324]|uniref:Uncharacterized protein n=1 Tax=Suhomyces tanzawaensis NRRL Y-17324 TaxID=984487 RepID=A0A1E4SRG3_9ASCO|nr:uncharacterized protein CANTADRAFT_19688 [Suhomyces tanzawaensis NRRL Y-17324]ODV82103.1 hypothetical protein CANTADRAFT_19688 [Suhomyces tanzawaensis NRRL Y-17324]